MMEVDPDGEGAELHALLRLLLLKTLRVEGGHQLLCREAVQLRRGGEHVSVGSIPDEVEILRSVLCETWFKCICVDRYSYSEC